MRYVEEVADRTFQPLILSNLGMLQNSGRFGQLHVPTIFFREDQSILEGEIGAKWQNVHISSLHNFFVAKVMSGC